MHGLCHYLSGDKHCVLNDIPYKSSKSLPYTEVTKDFTQ